MFSIHFLPRLRRVLRAAVFERYGVHGRRRRGRQAPVRREQHSVQKSTLLRRSPGPPVIGTSVFFPGSKKGVSWGYTNVPPLFCFVFKLKAGARVRSGNLSRASFSFFVWSLLRVTTVQGA